MVGGSRSRRGRILKKKKILPGKSIFTSKRPFGKIPTGSVVSFIRWLYRLLRK